MGTEGYVRVVRRLRRRVTRCKQTRRRPAHKKGAAMNLSVKTEVESSRATVVVSGEVDVSNADSLRSAIDEVLAADGVQAVDVDMADAPYIDSTGIGVLVGSAHKAHDAGVAFAVVDAQDNVVRILGMLGVDEVIDVRSSEGR